MESEGLVEYHDYEKTISCGTCSKIMCPATTGDCLKYGKRIVEGFDHLSVMFEYEYGYWTPHCNSYRRCSELLDDSLFEL